MANGVGYNGDHSYRIGKLFPRYCLAFVVATGLLGVSAASARMMPVERQTTAAVRTADEAWSAAEERGDADYVEWLLMPGYISVGPDGSVHTKSTIVKGARKRAGKANQLAAAKDAAWRAEHPYRTEVKLFGRTAVATFISTNPKTHGLVNSTDIFVYLHGHWHEIYSQHSATGI